jgi:hypothetical protein
MALVAPMRWKYLALFLEWPLRPWQEPWIVCAGA